MRFESYDETFLLTMQYGKDATKYFSITRPLFTYSESPDWAHNGGYLSIPMYAKFARQSSIDHLLYGKTLIAMKDPSDHAAIDKLVDQFKLNLDQATEFTVTYKQR